MPGLALPGRALFAAERTPDLLELDALAAAELVRKGEVSAVELVRSAIERVERLDLMIHAVVPPFPDHAIGFVATVRKDAPIGGVPYLVEDLSDYAGFRTARGSRAFATAISERTDPYIQPGVAVTPMCDHPRERTGSLEVFTRLSSRSRAYTGRGSSRLPSMNGSQSTAFVAPDEQRITTCRASR